MRRNPITAELKWPCIYRLENLVTGDFYIGSAWNGFERYKEHMRDLKKGRHHNHRLQSSFVEHGITAFQWVTLSRFRPEDVSRESLYRLEQQYLNSLRPTFNLALEVKLVGQTDEQRARAAQKQSKEYWVTDPTGAEFLIKGLKRFCRERGLNPSSMTFVLNGTWSHHRGWKIRPKDAVSARYQHRQSQEWIVTSPDGVESRIRNLKGHCRAHGLTKNTMLGVANGRSSHHKGWKCRRTTDSEPVYTNRRGKACEITLPDGSAVRASSLARYCKENGLSYISMTQIASGRRSTPYRGYFARYLEESERPAPGAIPENEIKDSFTVPQWH